MNLHQIYHHHNNHKRGIDAILHNQAASLPVMARCACQRQVRHATLGDEICAHNVAAARPQDAPANGVLQMISAAAEEQEEEEEGSGHFWDWTCTYVPRQSCPGRGRDLFLSLSL